MSKQDRQARLTDKHRSNRPRPKPGKETTHQVGYLADTDLRKLALRQILATVEKEYPHASCWTHRRETLSRYKKSIANGCHDPYLGTAKVNQGCCA